MKKVLISLFAVAAMVSCSNDELVELNQQAIAFGDAFVDNATRADYSSGKLLESFKVYGTANGVLIFDGDAVTRPASLSSGYDNTKAWECTETQYWVPNATYNFAAIVDGGEPVTAMPTTIPFTVADGADNKDLLYAEATATVNPDGTVTNLTNDMVAFTFNHLLSKLYFTVNVDPTMTGYTVTPTSIAVTGVQKNGIYTIDGTYDGEENGTWEKNGGDITSLEFVNGGVLQSRQIIPVQQTLDVTITYETYFGGAMISSATKKGTITHAFEKNTVYNIGATISGTKIQFTVTGCEGFDTTGGNINM